MTLTMTMGLKNSCCNGRRLWTKINFTQKLLHEEIDSPLPKFWMDKKIDPTSKE